MSESMESSTYPLINISDTTKKDTDIEQQQLNIPIKQMKEKQKEKDSCEINDYNKMLIETIYRDNLLSYQEKINFITNIYLSIWLVGWLVDYRLRKEYEERYQKSIETFKLNHEKEINLKLKQLDRSNKKRILDMALLYKQKLEYLEKEQTIQQNELIQLKQDDADRLAQLHKSEQLLVEQQQQHQSLIDQFKEQTESSNVILEQRQLKIDSLEQKQLENQQEITRLISQLDIVSTTISELLVSSDNIASQNQVFQKFIESLESNDDDDESNNQIQTQIKLDNNNN
ncbi:hypothetical protein PPL_11160 [Heterostelium album PN500]|uniref:Uncharacterized protein n=1 Tax=Heterostelium pallidum (strain ATCC 26659 / Pp 5 / PN500) TaxID=670386 RepID=D3BTQ0_HETP5|nr:hypothetical protein PPL_11160 [Heterostelium album PN500]EFA75086.1 hypothetical protein PPL_11160 [Heterostelium album PN500]|eukprot:XP_020427220.1 hypothetical protein PPL_11160 [Heterostelium album PN500]